MRVLLEEEFPGKLVRVCTDMDLTLEAIGDGAAIVLIGGAGSAAIGRDARGRAGRVGGHGYLLGDEGSAYHVGQRAVLAALRHFERTGADIPMGRKILAEIGASTWADLQSRVYAAPDEVFPRIFPIVLQERRTRDRKSTRLNSSHQIISYAVFCLKKKIIRTSVSGIAGVQYLDILAIVL